MRAPSAVAGAPRQGREERAGDQNDTVPAVFQGQGQPDVGVNVPRTAERDQKHSHRFIFALPCYHRHGAFLQSR